MKLFYSYCRKDEEFRDAVEKHLEMLRENNLINEWHDRKILPGSKWDNEIKDQMEFSDIILLLISPDFLASPSCKEEIGRALNLSREKGVIIIPIVLKPCAWKDNQEIKKLQALPKDGNPVTCWDNRDKAFLNIYEGIESVIKNMEFSIKKEFKDKATKIEFISQNKEHIKLDDIFVFPNIFHITEREGIPVTNFDSLWNINNHLILKGNETSGKTTICRKLFFECVSEKIPIVMISGQEITSPIHHEALIERNFNEQFHGNYKRWWNLKNKVIVIDGLDSSSRLEFLGFAEEHFDRIFVATSEDEFVSYFKYEEKLANYELLTIRPFKHSQQENLIKRWKSLTNPEAKPEQLNHGEIDQIEDKLNSIIHNNKIVPRYPFFILSILQTYEGFMPQNTRITAYGHCYQALITAQLINKCGIQKEDIDSAFNFLTHLAHDIFSSQRNYSEIEFDKFVQSYGDNFVINNSVANRLKKGGVIAIDQHGKFQFPYSFVYYFFLGNFFALNYKQNKNTVDQLAEKSYLRDNRYILIFTIHHTHDDDLIETILLHTMMAMDHHSIAKLTAEETKPLLVALAELPLKIISQQPTEKNRKKAKDQKDKEEITERTYEKEHEIEDVNSLYKSLKNMEILGQILRTKYGSFPKNRLREIVTTIADAGLRIVTLITDDDSMRDLEDYLVKRVKELDTQKNSDKMEERMRRLVRTMCFFMMAIVIGKIVTSIRKPELAEVVNDACRNEDTPAYDLIDFFFVLGTATELEEKDVDKLKSLLKKFDKDGNKVAKRLLSIVTQDYLNKHNVQYKLRQKIFKALGFEYKSNTFLKF